MSTGPIRWLQPLRTVAAWLLDRAGCPPIVRRSLSALVFGAFVTLVLVGAAHHEVWRDEARALTLALEPGSWFGLVATLENEGHPGLWHLLLRLAHGIAGTPMVLQIVAPAIGIGASALLFFGAPLPTWWRVTFLFGWVPLFECSVLCRNYGICVLLLFVFCALVSRAAPRPVLAAIALALLANTNVYGTMMACGLGLFLVVEAVRSKVPTRLLSIVLLVIGAGIALSVWTMLPTSASKLVPSVRGKFGDLWGTAFDALRGFGATTTSLFGWLAPLAWGVVLLTALATLSMPHLAAAVLAVFAAAAWFMQRIYGPGPHHLGMLFAFLVAVTWIRAGRSEAAVTGPALPRNAWRVLLFGVWPPLLLFQGYRGLLDLKTEVEYSRSSAPELARLLERDDLAFAVLIGEPDYYLDAMPFYRDNRIFIAREGRFGRRVSWTIDNRRELDLGELLAAARKVQREQDAPVLLVIGQPVQLEPASGDVKHGYGHRFRWSAPQLEEFRASTQHLASLPARPSRFRGDERYEVFRLR